MLQAMKSALFRRPQRSEGVCTLRRCAGDLRYRDAGCLSTQREWVAPRALKTLVCKPRCSSIEPPKTRRRPNRDVAFEDVGRCSSKTNTVSGLFPEKQTVEIPRVHVAIRSSGGGGSLLCLNQVLNTRDTVVTIPTERRSITNLVPTWG